MVQGYQQVRVALPASAALRAIRIRLHAVLKTLLGVAISDRVVVLIERFVKFVDIRFDLGALTESRQIEAIGAVTERRLARLYRPLVAAGIKIPHPAIAAQLRPRAERAAVTQATRNASRCPANANRCNRGAQAEILFVRTTDDAGNQAHATAHQIEKTTLLAVGLAGVMVVLDAVFGIRLQSRKTAVGEAQLGAPAARCDGIAGTEQVATRKCARSAPRAYRLDLAKSVNNFAGLGCGTGGEGHAQQQRHRNGAGNSDHIHGLPHDLQKSLRNTTIASKRS